MMVIDPSLAFQKAVRGLLTGTTALTDLVPATSIFDRHSRPEAFPCIVMGEDQTVDDNTPLARDRAFVFADLHVWTKESGFAQCKAIAGQVRAAIKGGFFSIDGHHLIDLMVVGIRYLRDPSGEHAHAVVQVEAYLQEEAL